MTSGGDGAVSAVGGRLRDAVRRAVLGQERVVEAFLTAFVCGGHVLLEGVPGLAKTLLAKTAAEALGLSFRRIQFTPDLLPADLTGTDVIRTDPATGERAELFLPGPLFAHVVLADEINRAPPKTQAALLEAMEERQITVGGKTTPLPDPFWVLATENPIEQEGTYPLPHAQRDRFLMKIDVDYPGEADERRIAVWTGAQPSAISHPPESFPARLFAEAVAQVRLTPVPEPALAYACAIVRRTRPRDPETPSAIAVGASPRATRDLVLAAQGRAALAGRIWVSRRDIEAVAGDVLRHRILLHWGADAAGFGPDGVVADILASLSSGAPAASSHPLVAELLR